MSWLVLWKVFKVVSVGIWNESVVLLYASVAGDNGVDVILEDGGWYSVQELEEESLVLLSLAFASIEDRVVLNWGQPESGLSSTVSTTAYVKMAEMWAPSLPS